MMYKYLLNYAIWAIWAICALILTACEQQKQASAEVGAIPKTIIDNATNDINATQALATEKAKALENADGPVSVAK